LRTRTPTLHLERRCSSEGGNPNRAVWPEVPHEISRLIFANLSEKRFRLILTIDLLHRTGFLHVSCRGEERPSAAAPEIAGATA